MLIGPVWAVAHRPTEAPDQELLKTGCLQVQVRAAFRVSKGVFSVVSWVMVSGHIKKRNIQKSQQVLKVRVGQVSTSEDKLHFAKVTACTKSIKTFDDFIADCKNFHNRCIVPQNDVPCKGIETEERTKLKCYLLMGGCQSKQGKL